MLALELGEKAQCYRKGTEQQGSWCEALGIPLIILA